MYYKKLLIFVMFSFIGITSTKAQEKVIITNDPLMFYFHHIRPNLIRMHVELVEPIKKPIVKNNKKSADKPKQQTAIKPKVNSSWINSTFRGDNR